MKGAFAIVIFFSVVFTGIASGAAPLPEDWDDTQVRSYLREYNVRSIHDLTIHEAMPGHFVQLAHANRFPSLLRAVFASGTFVEGWAM